MKNKNGFVLMETIVVISVLCTILVVLYASYENIHIKVQKKSLYDNTEYIFKTSLVRNHLESTLSSSIYSNSNYTIICQNSTSNKCYSDDILNNYQNELFKFLKVEGVYITVFDVDNISSTDLSSFEATTQNYIKYLDPPKDKGGFRIIVMFEQENNDTTKSIYEYASLKFGSRD